MKIRKHTLRFVHAHEVHITPHTDGVDNSMSPCKLVETVTLGALSAVSGMCHPYQSLAKWMTKCLVSRPNANPDEQTIRIIYKRVTIMLDVGQWPWYNIKCWSREGPVSFHLAESDCACFTVYCGDKINAKASNVRFSTLISLETATQNSVYSALKEGGHWDIGVGVFL